MIRYVRNHHGVLAQSVQSQLLDTVQESSEEKSRRDKEGEAAVKRKKEVSFHKKGRERRERERGEQKRSELRMTENRVLTSCALTRHDDNRNSTVITYSTVHCTAAYVREEGKAQM